MDFSGKSVVLGAVLTVGVVVFGYGLLTLSSSVLGGVWIAAIGLSIVLSGASATAWVGNRLGLSVTDRRTLSLAFAALAVVLLGSFVVVNFVAFESGDAVS